MKYEDIKIGDMVWVESHGRLITSRVENKNNNSKVVEVRYLEGELSSLSIKIDYYDIVSIAGNKSRINVQDVIEKHKKDSQGMRLTTMLREWCEEQDCEVCQFRDKANFYIECRLRGDLPADWDLESE